MNKYHFVKDLDTNISRIGCGTWQLGGPVKINDIELGYRESNYDDTIEAYEILYNAGLNFFDTADIYGLGLSEERLSKFIKIKEKI